MYGLEKEEIEIIKEYEQYSKDRAEFYRKSIERIETSKVKHIVDNTTKEHAEIILTNNEFILNTYNYINSLYSLPQSENYPIDYNKSYLSKILRFKPFSLTTEDAIKIAFKTKLKDFEKHKKNNFRNFNDFAFDYNLRLLANFKVKKKERVLKISIKTQYTNFENIYNLLYFFDNNTFKNINKEEKESCRLSLLEFTKDTKKKKAVDINLSSISKIYLKKKLYKPRNKYEYQTESDIEISILFKNKNLLKQFSKKILSKINFDRFNYLFTGNQLINKNWMDMDSMTINSRQSINVLPNNILTTVTGAAGIHQHIITRSNIGLSDNNN